jgi:hypothetical protein
VARSKPHPRKNIGDPHDHRDPVAIQVSTARLVEARSQGHGHGAPHVGAAALPIAHQAPGRPDRAGPLHRAAQQRSPSRVRRPIKVELGYAPPANHHRRLDASLKAYQASKHPRPSGDLLALSTAVTAAPDDTNHSPAPRRAAQRHRGHGRTARSSPSLIVGECAIRVRRRAGHLLPRPVAVHTGVLLLNDSQTPARRVGVQVGGADWTTGPTRVHHARSGVGPCQASDSGASRRTSPGTRPRQPGRLCISGLPGIGNQERERGIKGARREHARGTAGAREGT